VLHCVEIVTKSVGWFKRLYNRSATTFVARTTIKLYSLAQLYLQGSNQSLFVDIHYRTNTNKHLQTSCNAMQMMLAQRILEVDRVKRVGGFCCAVAVVAVGFARVEVRRIVGVLVEPSCSLATLAFAAAVRVKLAFGVATANGCCCCCCCATRRGVAFAVAVVVLRDSADLLLLRNDAGVVVADAVALCGIEAGVRVENGVDGV
jgi:hypothetical protein